MPTVEPTRIAPNGELPVTSWVFDVADDTDLPVLLGIHDLTANGLWFGDLAAAGAGRFRMAAPDLRGRAASMGSAAPRSLADHVTDLLRLADRLDAATFAIVGHGTGTIIALTAADTAPTRVTKVVLLDGPPILTDMPDADAHADWMVTAARIDPGIERLRRTWAHRDAHVADGVASGRIPRTGMTRALRRAVQAETTGTGFGWQPRLAVDTLERDWTLYGEWSPPRDLRVATVQLHAIHGHRIDDPPNAIRYVGSEMRPLDTTHTGILGDPTVLGVVVDAIEDPSAVTGPPPPLGSSRC